MSGILPARLAGRNDFGVIDPVELKTWLHDRGEIALLDLREQGQYGEAHLFYAVPLPYSRLELEIGRLVPNRRTRVVVYDDGVSGIARLGAARLVALGYVQVAVLDGGAAAWRAAGYQLFAGVHVPSKTFGELVEHERHTPTISAADLKLRVDRGDDLVVLDGRTPEEFRKMNIPGAMCCPNGELPYRIGEIVKRPETTIVVNCAGRTRSIIGAQTLIDIGVPNPVLALENGTQGWFLAGQQLEHGTDRMYPPAPTGDRLAIRQQAARALMDRHGVAPVDPATVAEWLADPARNTYLLDVRTAEEFAAGAPYAAQHAPAGQLLQATDLYVGVRNARLVLCDSEGVRAPVCAAWLAQMGHEVHVLDAGRAPEVLPPAAAASLAPLPAIDAAALASLVAADGCAIYDLRPSAAYRRGHLRGAIWTIRPRIAGLVLDPAKVVVLVADEPALAAAAALDFAERGATDIRLFAGPAGNLATEATPDRPADEERIDYLFFVHDRHDGNAEAARRYLAWETNLIRQIDEQERAAFRIRDAV